MSPAALAALACNGTAGLGAHLGYDALVAHSHGSNGGVGTATVVLYLAVSLGVQRLIAQLHASRMGLAPVGPPGPGLLR
jgi:hypothetical protein